MFGKIRNVICLVFLKLILLILKINLILLVKQYVYLIVLLMTFATSSA